MSILTTLPTDSATRKEYPLLSGFLNYFPAAIARAARVSFRGNQKHNPGRALHHSRGKSSDHGDCIIRHTMDLEDVKAAIVRDEIRDPAEYKAAVALMLDEAAARFWRAGADLQELCEKYDGAPLAPGAKLP